ncbi:MAG: MBL fold metallo-hydrolase [Solobacterium sp.]|nr:MBL fold metallo-hydrolase [Solobacterium sp.]
MEFALLASGSKGNAFLLRDRDTEIMIDCGTTKRYLSECFQKLKISVQDLDALLITHDHTDHISQIRHFRNLSIYSPVEITDTEVFLVRPLQQFAVNSLQITPVALSHDAPNTTGYIIENGEEKLVYITDTGYLNQRYLPLMQDADYIIMESNHDTEMLMQTRRPQYLKYRIYGDQGHLNNEDCADILTKLAGPKTKMIILAHISQEANTRLRALDVSRKRLQECGSLRKDLILAAAGQHEMIRKGWNNEKTDPGSVCCTVGMECLADLQADADR